MQQGLMTRLGIAIWSFKEALKGSGPLALPPDGRSSVESGLSGGISGYLEGLGSVSPVVDFAVLHCLKHLWIFNPDFSQYVANIVNIGNPGHSLTIDAKADSIAEAALNRLNDAASRLYPNGAGVDGLLNAYLAQVAWSGAISSEDVVNLPARRVESVVMVPVEEIRFRYLDGQYVPFQYPKSLIATMRGSLGLIPLNPNTYHYYALQTVENSPYAKPPASAAVALLTGAQKDILDNIKFIVAKMGILGMVSVSVTPPTRKPGDSEGEYQTRAANYLRSVRDALEGNFNQGLLVTYRDQKVEHANVAAAAGGGMELIQWIEQLVMSAFAMPPAFFGRTDSTTETYANVVYNLLLAQIGNVQRLAKRRQEATYRLDLRLGGIEVDGVSLRFDKAHPRDPLAEASAQEVTVRTILEKARNGMITADEAAQEMGYESAADPELLTGQPELAQSFRALWGAKTRGREAVRFQFDQRSGRYRFRPTVLTLSASEEEPAAENNVVPIKKKLAVSG